MIVSRYQLVSNKTYLKSKLQIALVSDLHERDPKELLSLLRRETPDLILVAGDTLERHEEGYLGFTQQNMAEAQGLSTRWNIFAIILKAVQRLIHSFGYNTDSNPQYAYDFLAGAAEIAPVYMGLGNHEWYLLPEDRQFLKQHGIRVLHNKDRHLWFHRKRIRIGGLSTRAKYLWLEDFSKKNGFKILISHHPEYYINKIKGTSLDTFDLIVSGHAHGGQWRIFGHGILAPGQGFFPKYHHGLYDRHLISAGVSNTSSLPRFGNPCELVILDIYPNGSKPSAPDKASIPKKHLKNFKFFSHL